MPMVGKDALLLHLNVQPSKSRKLGRATTAQLLRWAAAPPLTLLKPIHAQEDAPRKKKPYRLFQYFN
jgi:hypothetical protein